jgi:hypothetical protein
MMLKKLWSKARKKNKGRNATDENEASTSSNNKDDTRITDASAVALAVVGILTTNENDSIKAMQLARAVLDKRIFEQQKQQQHLYNKRSKQLLSTQSLHGRIRSSIPATPSSGKCAVQDPIKRYGHDETLLSRSLHGVIHSRRGSASGNKTAHGPPRISFTTNIRQYDCVSDTPLPLPSHSSTGSAPGTSNDSNSNNISSHSSCCNLMVSLPEQIAASITNNNNTEAQQEEVNKAYCSGNNKKQQQQRGVNFSKHQQQKLGLIPIDDEDSDHDCDGGPRPEHEHQPASLLLRSQGHTQSRSMLLLSQSLHGRIPLSAISSSSSSSGREFLECLPTQLPFPLNEKSRKHSNKQRRVADGGGENMNNTKRSEHGDYDALPSHSLHGAFRRGRGSTRLPSQSLNGVLRQSIYSSSSNSAAIPHQRGAIKSSKQVQQQQERIDLMILLQQNEDNIKFLQRGQRRSDNIKLLQRGRRISDHECACEAIQGGSVPTKPASQPLPASNVVLQSQSRSHDNMNMSGIGIGIGTVAPPAFPQHENKKHSWRRRSADLDGDISARSAGSPSQSLRGALPDRRGNTSTNGAGIGPHVQLVGEIGPHSYNGPARGEVVVGSRQQTELLIRDGYGYADADADEDEDSSCSLRRRVISAREVQGAAASKEAASEAIARMVVISQNDNKDNGINRKDNDNDKQENVNNTNNMLIASKLPHTMSRKSSPIPSKVHHLHVEAPPALSHCQTSDGRQEIATLIIGLAEKLEEDRRAVMAKEHGHGPSSSSRSLDGQSQGEESSQESSLHENSYHHSMFVLRHCDGGDDHTEQNE